MKKLSFFTILIVFLMSVCVVAQNRPIMGDTADTTSKIGTCVLYNDLSSNESLTDWKFDENSSINKIPHSDGGYTNVNINKGNITYDENGYIKATKSGQWGAELYLTLGVYLKPGTYFTVADVYLDENTEFNKMDFGGDNQTDKLVALPDSMKGAWTTVISSPFTVDGTEFTKKAYLFTFKKEGLTAYTQEDILIDNISLYYLPNRTITFEIDESFGSLSKDSLTVTGQYADISAVTVTPTDTVSKFIGWTVKGDDTIISAYTTDYYTAQDVTLVAVFESDEYAPITSDTLEIRTKSPMGIRSMASVSYAQREKALEYGYVVAVTDKITEDELTLDSLCRKITGVAYNGADKDIVYRNDAAVERVFFTGVFHGIPKTFEAYRTSLTFRPYAKYEDKISYGKQISTSLYDVAVSIKNSDDFVNMSEQDKAAVNDIIKTGTVPFVKNGDAEDLENVAFTSHNAAVNIVEDARNSNNHVYDVVANDAGRAFTYFRQKGVSYEDGRVYKISFDACYTGIKDEEANKESTSQLSLYANTKFNDVTKTSVDHVVGKVKLTKGEWQTVNFTYTVTGLKNNDASEFTIYADPVDNLYAANFMIDNVVVEMTDEVVLELMGKTYNEQGEETDPTSFEVGDKVTFKVGVYQGMTLSDKCDYLKYTLRYDDGQASETGVVDASSGMLDITSKPLTKPGAVSCVVSICDKDGNLIKPNNVSSKEDLKYHFNGGAICGFDDIKLSVVETSEQKAEVDVPNTNAVFAIEEGFSETLSEFWARQLQTIENLDYSAAEITLDSQNDSYTKYKVYVPFEINSGIQNSENNKAAFYMVVPKNASAGSLKIFAEFQGYGCKNPSASYKEGYITLGVAAHSFELGREDSYYSALSSSGGPLYNYSMNYDKSLTNPDEYYYVGMLLRDVVAVRFAQQYKENGVLLYNGVTELSGGSQGGVQALGAGALLGEDVCKITSNVTGLCDLNGANVGRLPDVFTPSWADNGALSYFDGGMLAKLVNSECQVEIVAGLGDYTSPPSGIVSMYNNLASTNKSITFKQNMTHGQIVLPLSTNLDYTRTN